MFSPEQVFDIQYGITPVISYIKKYPKGLLICALNTIDFNRLIETIVLEKAQRRVILLPNGVDSDISMQYGWTMDTLSKPRQFYSTIPKAMFTSLDIWGNDQHFFKQWLCFGFNSISSTIFPITSTNGFEFTTETSNASQLIKLNERIKLSVDNNDIELPTISMLIVGNTETFCGNKFWTLTSDDYCDGWCDTETHDGMLEIYGFIDETHFKNCLKQIQTPVKITQGKSLSFTLLKECHVYFDFKDVLMKSNFTINKLFSIEIGVNVNDMK